MSFLVPEASSLPRFRRPKDTDTSAPPAEPERIAISPPRSRSSSINSTSSAKQGRMSSLLNKVKAKMGDHPNAVSEDAPSKPSSGVQDVPEGSDRSKFGQGGSHPAEQEVRFGSVTDENAASHTFRGTVHDTSSAGETVGGATDGVGGQADAQQAMQNVSGQGANAREAEALK